MRRILLFAIPLAVSAVLVTRLVTAQTGTPEIETPAPGEVEPTTPQTTPTLIPDIPAGADPMDRKPDPAGGGAAAEAPSQPRDAVPKDTECRVRRADTDTGFVVVCE